MTDIVNTLRQRHHNVTGGNPLIKPLVGPTMFSEAADEIERLRAERDEARKEAWRMAQRNKALVAELADRGRQFTPEQLKAAIVKALYEGEG